MLFTFLHALFSNENTLIGPNYYIFHFYYFCSSTVSSLVSFLANGLCLAKSSMYCPKIAFSCRSLKNQVSKYFKKNEIRFYYLKKKFFDPQKIFIPFFQNFYYCHNSRRNDFTTPPGGKKYFRNLINWNFHLLQFGRDQRGLLGCFAAEGLHERGRFFLVVNVEGPFFS